MAPFADVMKLAFDVGFLDKGARAAAMRQRIRIEGEKRWT
jgi:hypothetical protein